MKKYLLALLLAVIIVPSVAFASWWNPLSWSIFHRTEVVPSTQLEIQKTPEEKIDELQKQLDNLKRQTRPTVTQTPVVKKSPTQPSVTTNKNLDSTCLSFYEKMKALDIPPVETTPVYTSAELTAIKSASTGKYDPNLQDVFSKIELAKKLYRDTLTGNIAQKENLTTKYGFCYEYLSKTYGFIIN